MIIAPWTNSCEFGVLWTHYFPVVETFYKDEPILCYSWLNFLFKNPINDWIELPSKYRQEGWKRWEGSWLYPNMADQMIISPFDAKVDVYPVEYKPKYRLNARLVLSPRNRDWNNGKNYTNHMQKLIDENEDAVLCCRKEDLKDLKHNHLVVDNLEDIMSYYHYSDEVIACDSGLAQCASFCGANLRIIAQEIKVGYLRYHIANPNFKSLIRPLF